MRSLLSWRRRGSAYAIAVVGAVLLTSAAHGEAPTSCEAGAGAMSVHLDTDGHPTVPSSDEIAAVKRRQDVDPTSADVERPMPSFVAAPGGGEMVVLDDRFVQRSTVHRRAGEPLHIDCGLGPLP